MNGGKGRGKFQPETFAARLSSGFFQIVLHSAFFRVLQESGFFVPIFQDSSLKILLRLPGVFPVLLECSY